MIDLAELLARLDDPELAILDVRSRPEFTGERGYASDPRQGHIPGARHLWVNEIVGRTPEELRELVGLPAG
ncbi:MAG: rhodanese-like domain-containing protein, partial [Actinomycetota bacterium]|nr:rhodanese-like domain-containing protein [Actinomycetota bacterium]